MKTINIEIDSELFQLLVEIFDKFEITDTFEAGLKSRFLDGVYCNYPMIDIGLQENMYIEVNSDRVTLLKNFSYDGCTQKYKYKTVKKPKK